MPTVDVRCSVQNCYFWAQENFCGASSILISHDRAGGAHQSVGVDDTAMVVSEIGETPVDHPDETACKTFVKRS